MPEKISTTETTTATPVAGGASVQTVTEQSRGGAAVAENIIRFIVGLLEAILAIRFVLSLLGANQANAFASIIYNLTAPFLSPFFGLFGYTVDYGIARLEFETLVAMAVYALIGFAIIRLIRIGRS